MDQQLSQNPENPPATKNQTKRHLYPLSLAGLITGTFSIILLISYAHNYIFQPKKAAVITYEDKQEIQFSLDDTNGLYYISEKDPEYVGFGLKLEYHPSIQDYISTKYKEVEIQNPDFVRVRGLAGEFVRVTGEFVEENDTESNNLFVKIDSVRRDDFDWQTPLKLQIPKIMGIYQIPSFVTGQHGTTYKQITQNSYNYYYKNLQKPLWIKELECESDPTVIKGSNTIFDFAKKGFFKISKYPKDSLTLYGPLYIIELENGDKLALYKTDLGYYAFFDKDADEYTDYRDINMDSTTSSFTYTKVENVVFIDNYRIINSFFEGLLENVKEETCTDLSVEYNSDLDCINYEGSTGWEAVYNNRKCTAERILIQVWKDFEARDKFILDINPTENPANLVNEYTSPYGYTIKYPNNWDLEEKKWGPNMETGPFMSTISLSKTDTVKSPDVHRRTFFHIGSAQVYSTSGALCANIGCPYGGALNLNDRQVVINKIYGPILNTDELSVLEYRFRTRLENIRVMGSPLFITGEFLDKKEGQEVADILNSIKIEKPGEYPPLEKEQPENTTDE